MELKFTCKYCKGHNLAVRNCGITFTKVKKIDTDSGIEVSTESIDKLNSKNWICLDCKRLVTGSSGLVILPTNQALIQCLADEYDIAHGH